MDKLYFLTNWFRVSIVIRWYDMMISSSKITSPLFVVAFEYAFETIFMRSSKLKLNKNSYRWFILALASSRRLLEILYLPTQVFQFVFNLSHTEIILSQRPNYL